MELTKDQTNAFNQIMGRLGAGQSSSRFFPNFSFITVGGFAGTGKTFLIATIRNEISNKWGDLRVAFGTFTGKASSVLKTKLEEQNAIYYDDFCGTIHSLIYRPELKYDSKIKKMVVVRWIKKDLLDYDLIIIDEASMINFELWKDLLSYKIPIIAVGDHGQLPPIGDKFNLMGNPDYTLTEVKRQSLENPIIKLSQDIRNGINIPYGFYDQNHKGVFKLPWSSEECKKLFESLNFSNSDIIVLCALNKTRVHINQMIREKLGFHNPEPYPGERIVFLKNNYYSKVLNGMLGQVLFLLYEAKNIYNMTIKVDEYEDPFSGLVHNCCFGKEQYENTYEVTRDKKVIAVAKKAGHQSVEVCDFGYCISTHKSQGSEFKKVVIFQERSNYWDDEYMRKWNYTAATRAKEKLFIITPN